MAAWAGDSDESPASPDGSGAQVEQVVAGLRSHGRAMFFPSLVLIAASGAAGYLVGRFEEDWQNLAVLAAAVVLAVLLWFVPLLLWLTRRYTITTRRIVLRHGFVVRTRQELLHSRGYDVSVRKNAVQAVFGSGNVLINTGLDRPVVLRDVPNADLVQEVLHDLMEASMNPIAARRQAGQSAPPDETTWFGRR